MKRIEVRMGRGSIPPTVWGPIFWHTIHLTALGYPKEPTFSEKKAAKEFYESLTHLIPCPICKLHYAEHLKALPLTPSLDSRTDLFRWTVDMHNRVNKDLGKPEYTEQDAVAFYYSLGERGRSPLLTPQDLHAEQFMEILKYMGMGLGGFLLLGGSYWALQKYFKG